MHIKVHNAGQVNEEDLKFVVICVKFKSQWLLVRHKERTTWEMPGGHIEGGESSQAAALRELYEETVKRKEFWNDGMKKYYPLGYTDPDFTLIRFTASKGNYYHGLKNIDFDI